MCTSLLNIDQIRTTLVGTGFVCDIRAGQSGRSHRLNRGNPSEDELVPELSGFSIFTTKEVHR